MVSSKISPRDEVIALLRRLLNRASDGIESGEFALTKPKEVLDVAKLLLELLGQGSAPTQSGKRLLERLRKLDGV